MSSLSVGEVVRNPEWLPHRYDPDGRALTLVHLPRDARSELMFLFDQHFGGKFTKISFPAASVAAAVDSEAEGAGAPLHFIFHTSFCGSTLLAKALEIPGVAASIREPAIFTNLANHMIRSDNQNNADRLELILRLVARPLAANEAVLTKQSTFANRLADEILQASETSRAVLLFSDLETYLISLLKRGLKGRIWGRKLFTNIMSWSTLKLDLNADDIMELTDMQVAAVAWLMQIHNFNRLAKAFGPRIMLLDASEMFALPGATLHAVTQFFGFGLTQAEAADIAAGPVFAKHSKFSDRDYSVDERRRDRDIVGQANSEEISMVAKWLQTLAHHHGIGLQPTS